MNLLLTCMYEAGQVVGPTSLPKPEVAALEWMSREVPREALILATYPTGNYIPRLSGQRVFIGEDKLTEDLAGRQGDVERFVHGLAPHQADATGGGLEKATPHA